MSSKRSAGGGSPKKKGPPVWFFVPAILWQAAILRKVYSLYLQGKSTYDIRIHLQARGSGRMHLDERDINGIIDEMNDAFL